MSFVGYGYFRVSRGDALEIIEVAPPFTYLVNDSPQGVGIFIKVPPYYPGGVNSTDQYHKILYTKVPKPSDWMGFLKELTFDLKRYVPALDGFDNNFIPLVMQPKRTLPMPGGNEKRFKHSDRTNSHPVFRSSPFFAKSP